jgi:hypothetical protein
MQSEYNKNYIEILGPPNDYYCRWSEPPTRRYRCSYTGVGLTLLLTAGGIFVHRTLKDQRPRAEIVVIEPLN